MSAASPVGRSVARELTLRGIVIGGLITLVFTAANVYLGLKVGLTFATSIPAAVISMAILRYFADHSVVENNIVQTIASAAGTLSAIIFVLPGLVIVGWWQGFPYWTTMAVCLVGGVLGVAYSIPLRRALVTGSDLPYPEGVAGAEVLRVGDTSEGAEENRRGLRVIVVGSLTAVGFSLLAAMKLVSNSLQKVFHLGGGGTMVGSSLSLALIGVGHLVGLSVGIAMVIGVLISFGVMLPIRTAGHLPAHGDITGVVTQTFGTDVRFIGAGAIAVSALWTLAKLAKPVVAGLIHTLAAARGRDAADSGDRDLSPASIAGWLAGCLLVVAGLVVHFVHGTPLSGHTVPLVLITLGFVIVGGFIVSAICGYLAGLVGSTNSPISGVGILAILMYAGLLGALIEVGKGAPMKSLVAFSLFTLSIVFAAATTSNDNLQDLKTGQLVGAAPWAQQIALIVGVLAGAVIIPPVLDLLARAYGFAGQVGGPVSSGNAPLPAPQAVLISALAQGVLEGNLNLSMLGIGAVIGAVVIGLDEFLGIKKWMRLPPLGVCIGIYLPMSASLPVVIGAGLSEWLRRKALKKPHPEKAEARGTLVASGLIVGESLLGVALAALIVATGKEAPLGVVGAHFAWATAIGGLVFLGIVVGLYRWILRAAE